MARVLIADDSEFIRDTLRKILKKSGHEVVAEAANGEQAFLEFEKYKPDIMTIDITMPGSDGIKVIKKITEKYSDSNIIVISAQTNKNLIFEALHNGAKTYITKPFSDDEVLSKIDKLSGAAVKL